MNSTSKIKTEFLCDMFVGKNNKYNYLYKILNNINNKYYYGVHSTDNINDSYRGSGKILQTAYKKYGLENFTKYIIECFNTEEDMFNKEFVVVNENIVNDKNSYNMRIGGTGNKKGQSIMKDEFGNFVVIQKTDKNYSEYNGVTKGYVCIYKENKRKSVNKNKLQLYLDDGWKIGGNLKQNAGKISIYKEDKMQYIKKEDLDKYIEEGWNRGIPDCVKKHNSEIQKGFVSIKTSDGKIKRIKKEQANNIIGITSGYKWITNGIENKSLPLNDAKEFLTNNKDWRYGCTIKQTENNKRNFGNIWINNGTNNKVIKPEDLNLYMQQGWKKGQIKHNGTLIHIYNDKKSKMVHKNELQKFLDEGWKKGRNISSNLHKLAICKNGKMKYIKEDELNDYLKDGWKKSGKSKNTGKKYIHKENMSKMVYPQELQTYLDDGWILGNLPTIKGRIFINKNGKNKIIKKEDLEYYEKDGWKKGKIKAS